MELSQDETKVNILLVDDHLSNLTALSAVLSNPGYNLIKATSGGEALSLLLKYEFAVVLLDVMMPEMDGFAVAHAMKSREATRHTPIIFITATATDIKFIFQGYSIGAVDYIQKPFEPAIVTAKVAVFADLFRKGEFIRNSEKAKFLKKEHEARVRAEGAEQRFKDLTNSLDHAIIWEANVDLSKFTYVSNRSERLLGYLAEAWMSETNFFLNHIPKEDQPIIMGVLYRLSHPSSASDGLGERCEHRILDAGGVEKWFHSGFQYYKGEQGNIAGIRGLCVDIHSLKGVEFALRDSQERLDFALRASRLGMWDWNLITDRFIASDTLRTMFGYDSLNFPNNMEVLRKRIHPEDVERHRETLKRATESAEDYDLEYRIVLPDGQIRWISSKGKAFFDSNLKPVRIAGTVMDITEKKEIEEKEKFLSDATLQLSSTIDYQATLRKIADLLIPKFASWCIIDLIENNTIQRVVVRHGDPKYAELAKKLEAMPADLNAPGGAPKALKSGESVLFPPEKMYDLSDSYHEVPMIGTRDPEQLEIIQQLGIRSYVSALVQVREMPLGIITLVRDNIRSLFKQKDLEFLEEIARRAALAIDNSRLYREAQTAITAREDLVAFVSHDLKNALSAIILSGKIMEKSLKLAESGEKPKNTLRRIQSSAQQMNDLINNVLDLTKLASGGFSINPANTTIASIIDGVIDIVRLDADLKGIQVERSIDTSIEVVFCDGQQLSRALTNLVANAIKFTPNGGTIFITVTRSDSDILFSVKDSGPGIPPEQQEHVFNKFWQAKETAHKGSGLGLTITKGIVEAHKGNIWIESEVGKGTSFCFKLPGASKKAA